MPRFRIVVQATQRRNFLAMPDFHDPEQFKRLIRAVEWSEKKLSEFRADFKEVTREFAGFYYGEDAADGPRPLNEIQIGATIYHRKISISEPQALVTTRYRELLPSAEDFRLGLNHTLSAIDVEKPLNRAALSALFALGMVKVGIDPETLDVFVEDILFQDVILDLSAMVDKQMAFVGHRYRMPVDWVKENDGFDEVQRMRAEEGRRGGGPFGGTTTQESTQTLSVGEGYIEDYKPHTELVDLYLPNENLLITYLASDPKVPLAIVEWEGPPSPFGPFRMLSFIEIPGNVMPVGPVQFWRDIHNIVNILANKTFDQAERQKDITLVPHELDKDGKAIVESGDGEAVPVSEPKGVVQQSFGGANQINLGMVMWTRNLSNEIQGNRNVIGGYGPGSDTVGQDQIMLQSTGTQIEAMQHKMLSFVREVITDVAWWLWTDTTGYIDLQRPIPGTQRSITYRWDFRRKKGDFFQFNFDVEPYSIARRSPQQRLQNLIQMWQGLVMPSLGPMQQQGMGFDYERFFKLAADYANEPDFAHLITYVNGEQYPQGPPKEAGSSAMPTNLNKPNGHYTRKSEGSVKGFEADMMNRLFSAQQQTPQKATA